MKSWKAWLGIALVFIGGIAVGAIVTHLAYQRGIRRAFHDPRRAITHAHGDHCHGIDELRPIAQALGGPVPLHARVDVISELQHRFAYAFETAEFYRPIAELHRQDMSSP